MTGFRNFILRGNLIELAVALIMALAFTAIVNATVDLIMGVIGKIGGQPDFRGWTPFGLAFGAWVTAVISFLVISAVVYFFIVVPYTKAKEKFFPAEEPGLAADIQLLQEIRDLLATQQGKPTGTVPDTTP